MNCPLCGEELVFKIGMPGSKTKGATCRSCDTRVIVPAWRIKAIRDKQLGGLF
jgi:hypothetical protein